MMRTQRKRSLWHVDPTQLKRQHVATLQGTHVSLRFTLVLRFAACVDIENKTIMKP